MIDTALRGVEGGREEGKEGEEEKETYPVKSTTLGWRSGGGKEQLLLLFPGQPEGNARGKASL